MTNDINRALSILEAQDREGATGRRRVAEKSMEYAHRQLGAVRSSGGKALDLAKRGGVSYVETAAALGRKVQGAVIDDAVRALDCVGRVAGAKSVGEAATAQVKYARAQTGVAVERWRLLGAAVMHAASAGARTLDGEIREIAR